MMQIYLFILYITIWGQKGFAQIQPNNNTTINSTLLKALQPPEGRVINGSPAQQGQFPFQVYIIADKYGCGGSIINNNTVVTAAHCVYYQDKKNKLIPANKIKIKAGGVFIYSMQQFQVKKVIPHKKYNSNKFDYDIAILKINNYFWDQSPTAKIAPISLTSQRFPDNTECTASGWGYTVGNKPTSSPINLMYTKLKIYNHKMCNDDYKRYGAKITDSMICAANLNMSTVCSGDSGGPLTIKQKNNSTQLIGIVSFGINGCPTNVPSVYTDVYHYKNWIEKNAGNYGISYQVFSLSQLLCSLLLSSVILYLKN